MSRDAARRAIRTFLQTAVALLLPGIFGWLNALTDWAKSEGQAPFPDARSIAYLGVVAIVSGFVAAVTLLWNGIEDAAGKGLLRAVPPKPVRPDTGAAAPALLLGVGVLTAVGLLVMALIVALL